MKLRTAKKILLNWSNDECTCKYSSSQIEKSYSKLKISDMIDSDILKCFEQMSAISVIDIMKS